MLLIYSTEKHSGSSSQSLSVPENSFRSFWLFQDGMTGIIFSSSNTSTPFNVNNSVKQGCIPVPVLLTLFLTIVLNHAPHDSTHGVYLRYKLDGSLFDMGRLNARTRTLERLIMEALLADDCTLMAQSEHELQTIESRFAKAPHLFCLTISLNKTEVMHQPAPRSTATPSIDSIQLKSVNHFKYLGIVISLDSTLNSEMRASIIKASQPLSCLCSYVMSHRNIKMITKIKLHRAVVLTSHLCGFETWTLHRKHVKQLEYTASAPLWSLHAGS